ncbi:hypothetical protein M1523_04515 [Patescibacteria group bacterium]|nr:hypothetical protein [Patescibacteria group bacterium]MCL5091514.1 hypothetical protein [Patescibacteria group bacterium]
MDNFRHLTWRKRISLLASLLLLLLIGFGFLLRSINPTYKNRAAETNDIIRLNQQLLQLTRLPRSDSSLYAIALRRKELLLKELKQNPKAFLNHVLSPDKIAYLPIEIKNSDLVEKETKLEGRIDVLHFDDFNNKTSGTIYRMSGYNLHFSEDPPQVLTGTIVVASGIALNSELVVNPSDPGRFQIKIKPKAKTQAVGDIKIASLLINFADNPSYQPYTAEQVKNMLFDYSLSVNNYYKEVSFNQVRLSGNVFGYYTIPFSGNSNCDYEAWSSSAWAMAQQASVPLQDYDHYIYVFADNVCGQAFPAIAQLGGNEIWLFNTPSNAVIAHELGHNFGLNHANYLNCNGEPIDRYSNCTEVGYGDPYDVMGAGNMFHTNAFNMITEGWIPASRVINVSESGTYTISPLELSSTLPQAIRVLKRDTNDYYYLEYRQPIGVFDAPLSAYAGATRGVLIHLVRGNLLEATTLYINNYPSTSSFPALADGDSFEDTNGAVSITQISHDDNKVILSVVVPKITLTPTPTPTPTPTITPTPSATSQSGKALYFDGASYLQTQDTGNKVALTSQFTFEAWIKPDHATVSNFQTLLSRYYQSQPDLYYHLFLYTNKETDKSELRFSNGKKGIGSSEVIPANDWTHITLTRNGNTFTLFINGQTAASGDFDPTGQIPTNPQNVFYLGAWRPSSTVFYQYHGAMDAVRISNTVRDVVNNWNSGAYLRPYVVDGYTQAYWRFENNLTDQSQNNLSSTVVGTTTYVPGKESSDPNGEPLGSANQPSANQPGRLVFGLVRRAGLN